MEEDILNYLSTVMFRGTPCNKDDTKRLNFLKTQQNNSESNKIITKKLSFCHNLKFVNPYFFAT